MDNTGTINANGLTVDGSYTQRPGATLTANRMTVTGPVTLAGTFAPGSDQPAGVVIDNTGTAAVNGTFDGLPEGAPVGKHQLSYHGGDGNDVVLTEKSAAAGSTAAGARPQRAALTSGGVPLAWRLGAGALVSLLALVFLLRRRRRAQD